MSKLSPPIVSLGRLLRYESYGASRNSGSEPHVNVEWEIAGCDELYLIFLIDSLRDISNFLRLDMKKAAFLLFCSLHLSLLCNHLIDFALLHLLSSILVVLMNHVRRCPISPNDYPLALRAFIIKYLPVCYDSIASSLGDYFPELSSKLEAPFLNEGHVLSFFIALFEVN